VATLWGAKGVTAEHVYILGVCEEGIPGERRDEYPGTEADYMEEQRRLFYVSIRATIRLPSVKSPGMAASKAFRLVRMMAGRKLRYLVDAVMWEWRMAKACQLCELRPTAAGREE
jgi:superfamily I DNA/RNA helicase